MNAINYMSNGKEILEDEVTKGKEVRAYGDEPNPKKQKTGKPKPVVYLCPELPLELRCVIPRTALNRYFKTYMDDSRAGRTGRRRPCMPRRGRPGRGQGHRDHS